MRRVRQADPVVERRAPPGRAVSATPAAANVAGVDDAGERPAQHLAALPERRAHEREQRRRARRRAAVGGRSRRAPTRRSAVGMNTAAGTEPGEARRRPVRDLHADRAVGGRARRGDEALADLALHHHEHPLDRRHAVEQVAAPAAWRRCTAGWRRAPSRRAPPSSAGQSSVMASASTTVTSATSATTSRSTAARPRSTSTAVTVGAGLGEGQRQRAEPGADLDDAVARPDAGQVGDAPHGVRVGDEVLPEVAARGQAAARQQLAHRRARVASLAATDLDVDRRRRSGRRSRRTPAALITSSSCGSSIGRSAVQQSTDRSLATLTTTMRLPLGHAAEHARLGVADRAAEDRRAGRQHRRRRRCR